ncbi:MAG TPA: lipoate--protein ligase family protein [Longilinea sp.]|nr:lipoate--protein ligase family protein [Longilinea sp.]
MKALTGQNPPPWRLILSEPACGAWNMALDQALLESTTVEGSMPTLRLFSWQPACLSIGYAQSVKEVNKDTLDRLGWDLVRRPTGGRAILHTDELTYSITAPLSHPVAAGSVLESYRRLSLGLISALETIGLSVNADKTYPETTSYGTVSPVCFETPSNYEITVQGKKLIGSAQARRNNGLLQHGTLPLYGDLGRIIQVLNHESPEARTIAMERLNLHATTLESALGERMDWDTAARAFQSGFSTSLNINFILSQPTPLEMERATALVQDVYANPAWTFRL